MQTFQAQYVHGDIFPLLDKGGGSKSGSEAHPQFSGFRLCWAYFVGCITSPNHGTEEPNPILSRVWGLPLRSLPAHPYCAIPQNKHRHTSQPLDKSAGGGVGGAKAITEPLKGSALHRGSKRKMAALGIRAHPHPGHPSTLMGTDFRGGSLACSLKS